MLISVSPTQARCSYLMFGGSRGCLLADGVAPLLEGGGQTALTFPGLLLTGGFDATVGLTAVVGLLGGVGFADVTGGFEDTGGLIGSCFIGGGGGLRGWTADVFGLLEGLYGGGGGSLFLTGGCIG